MSHVSIWQWSCWLRSSRALASYLRMLATARARFSLLVFRQHRELALHQTYLATSPTAHSFEDETSSWKSTGILQPTNCCKNLECKLLPVISVDDVRDVMRRHLIFFRIGCNRCCIFPTTSIAPVRLMMRYVAGKIIRLHSFDYNEVPGVSAPINAGTRKSRKVSAAADASQLVRTICMAEM